ncbi:MAG: hypothetical protein IH627_16595 [Rubrivivax sp.]|nr:hypothetical protein [Rubrivivax sp.]
MKKRLLALQIEAAGLSSDLERRMAYVAIFRIALQHACVTLAEHISIRRERRRVPLTTQPALPVSNLRVPSDGTLVTSLFELLVLAENEGLSGVSKPIFQLRNADRPCWRLLSINEPRTIERLLGAFVNSRNDGIEGHGLVGPKDLPAESDSIEIIIGALNSMLPSMDETGNSYHIQLADNSTHPIQTLRPFDGNLICYRSIKRSTSDKCVVRAQIERGLLNRDEVSYEITDPFAENRSSGSEKYNINRTHDKNWSPLTLFPDRITKEFTGRSKEMEELADWIDDTESRACMLYGDGGIGKTTLAIEFIQRLFDGAIESKYRPELVTFYTAKKTRWGLGGLEIIRLSDVGLSDVATLIPRALDGKPLDRSWYVKEPEEIIQKLASYLQQEWGVSRNSHLLVLDNTETMAANADEVKVLAKQIRELSRRVGRILLTSRRREAIEAHQIEIKPLSEDESVKFLRARANVLNRRPILDAGDRTLAKYSRDLGCKPLILEVFVGALGEHGIGLQNAFDRVQRMHSQDLGEFLYSDAWNRTSNSMQHLFLLMTRISEIHDDTLLKLCCGQVGISVLSAYDAFEESRGIAQISRIEDSTQILFSAEFLKFCSGKTLLIDGREIPALADVDKIKARYGEFLRSRSAKVSDRIDRAYRHAYARAAYTAYREGRDEDCAAFYELAVSADPDNGWLYDRYAVFLAAKYPTRRAEALDWSKKATQLAPNDGDAWYTRGILEGRLHFDSDAVSSLDRAADLGKVKHLCLMQQARAYLEARPPNKALARSKILAAEANEPKNDPLYWKYQSEISALKRKAQETEPAASIHVRASSKGS